MLTWIKSYLSVRYQYVEMSCTESLKSKVERGIPQGLIKDPFFFTLYINEMKKRSDFKLAQYAIDSTAYLVGTSLETLTSRINYELQKVDGWLCANKLSLKVSKSFFSIFSNLKNSFTPIIKIKGENVPLMT